MRMHTCVTYIYIARYRHIDQITSINLYNSQTDGFGVKLQMTHSGEVVVNISLHLLFILSFYPRSLSLSLS